MIRNTSERGLTLMEVSVSLIIVGFAAAAIGMFANSAMQNSKTEAVVSDVAKLANSIRHVYQNKTGFVGLNEGDFVTSGLLPERMVNTTNGQIVTGYGQITIDSFDIECSGCRDGFAIVLRNVPSGVCQKLASRDYGSSIYRVLVSGETSSAFVDVLGNVSAVNTQCQIQDTSRVRLEFRG